MQMTLGALPGPNRLYGFRRRRFSGKTVLLSRGLDSAEEMSVGKLTS